MVVVTEYEDVDPVSMISLDGADPDHQGIAKVSIFGPAPPSDKLACKEESKSDDLSRRWSISSTMSLKANPWGNLGVVSQSLKRLPSQSSLYSKKSEVASLKSSRISENSTTADVSLSQAGRFNSQSASVDFTLSFNKMKTSSNSNRPAHYTWLKDGLCKLAENSASSLQCYHVDDAEHFVPLFFVIGACPNFVCSMQAVMYCRSHSRSKVDFWWVKPAKGRSDNTEDAIEMETLSRHSKGPHKNDPGRSRPFYQPLADLFEHDIATQGWHFGIEEASAGPDQKQEFRAFLQKDSDTETDEPGEKFYVHVFWLEDWSTNPLASKKYLRGKIVYQKRAGRGPLFARQYEIADEEISIFAFEEEMSSSYLPDDSVKTLWQAASMSMQSQSKKVNTLFSWMSRSQ